MRKITAGVIALGLAAVLTGCSQGAAPGNPEDAKAAFEGKTVKLVVPFEPGGGYDAYARLLAPELGNELGATVVVENKPGAGGILATNELVTAKPDGLTIALFNGPGHLGSALAKTDGVNYDAEAISYIGQISMEPDVVVGSGDTSIKSVEDMNGVRFAATGPGSNEYIDPVIFNELMGYKNEIVTGFASSNEANLSVVQGNADLHSRSLGSQLPGIKAGDLTPLLVIGESTGEEEIAEVPSLVDAVPEGKRELAELHSSLVSSGRIVGAPPEVPEATLEVLRDAFEAVVADEEFQASAEEAGRPVHFMSGADVQDLVTEIMNSPQEYVDLVTTAYEGA
ncbi:Bug family tripartite tricarboxylate transporter substrate binding protein [Arthrobacter sp. TMS1-12-1]